MISIQSAPRPKRTFQQLVHQELTALLDEHADASKENKNSVNKKINSYLRSQQENSICFGKTTIEGLDLTDLDLSNSDFSNCTLKNVNFYTCVLKNVNFSFSILSNVSFLGADRRRRNLVSVDFTNATFNEVVFSNCDLRASIFKLTVIHDVKLNGSWLSLDNLKFFIPLAKNKPPTISLDDISLEDQNLSRLNFDKLSLCGVYFRNANLNCTIFGNADIGCANLKRAKNLKIQQLYGCTNAKDATLPSNMQQGLKELRICIGEDKSRITKFFPKIK